MVEPGFVATDRDRRAEGPDPPVSAYDTGRGRGAAAFGPAVRSGMAPDAVASAVVRAATTTRPCQRLRPGRQAKRLRRISLLLPERLFAWGLRRRFDLPG